MPDLYIEAESLKNAAVANDADNDDVWELLADSVSRIFDRECEVEDGFFSAVAISPVAETNSYEGNGTKYLRVHPYVADSIAVIEVEGTDYFEESALDRRYKERDGYLVFNFNIPDGVPVYVTAVYGFSAVPPEVQQVCIEQALAMWRKKDLSFADLSGVSSAAILAEFTPTFMAVTKRYREKYSPNSFFS